MPHGAESLIAELEDSVGPAYHAPSGNGQVHVGDDGSTWLRSPCLGLCDQAPAAMVTVAGSDPAEESFGELTADRARRVLNGDLTGAVVKRLALPQQGDPALRLLKRVGVVDPTSIDEYRASGGYEALRRAFSMGADAVLREVIDSKLLGRGGAAFPIGRRTPWLVSLGVHDM